MHIHIPSLSGPASFIRAELGKLGAVAASDAEKALLAGISGLLANVHPDRQTTLTAIVHEAENLTKAYVEMTVVPTAADQEAKAEATRPATPAGPIDVTPSAPAGGADG